MKNDDKVVVNAIPFVFSEDKEYDFMSGEGMYTPNYYDVRYESFEKAYDLVVTNISAIVAKQQEKDDVMKVEKVTLNLEFGVDVATGNVGLLGGAKMELVLKPSEE